MTRFVTGLFKPESEGRNRDRVRDRYMKVEYDVYSLRWAPLSVDGPKATRVAPSLVSLEIEFIQRAGTSMPQANFFP